MSLRLISWNINSVRLRFPLIERLVAEYEPDLICLQEIKVTDELFPTEAFMELGFPHQAVAGQKGYHGVATLSRHPIETNPKRDWCGKGDSRHIAITHSSGFTLHNFYIPAGGDEPDPEVNDKFAHKLDFFDELNDWFKAEGKGEKQIMVGDFNVAPLECDVWSHKQLLKVVSHTPIEVEKMDRLMASLDWRDVIREHNPAPEPLFSWWSYRARDWRASNRGRRLDHVWVTPDLLAGTQKAHILTDARGWERPSDHAPVLVEFDFD